MRRMLSDCYSHIRPVTCASWIWEGLSCLQKLAHRTAYASTAFVALTVATIRTTSRDCCCVYLAAMHCTVGIVTWQL